jgi:hypothetical protein
MERALGPQCAYAAHTWGVCGPRLDWEGRWLTGKICPSLAVSTFKKEQKVANPPPPLLNYPHSQVQHQVLIFLGCLAGGGGCGLPLRLCRRRGPQGVAGSPALRANPRKRDHLRLEGDVRSLSIRRHHDGSSLAASDSQPHQRSLPRFPLPRESEAFSAIHTLALQSRKNSRH